MKKWIVVIALLMAGTPALAAKKPCDELKTEIDAKIRANGVKNFTLKIVPNDQVKDEKVVGSCDGGTKKILYERRN